jgi:hypothetical protein
LPAVNAIRLGQRCDSLGRKAEHQELFVMVTTDENADRFIERLAEACESAGMMTTVIEPSTRIRIHAPHDNEYFDEVITLRPDVGELLTWYWSWGTPICPAHDIATAITMIRKVIA